MHIKYLHGCIKAKSPGVSVATHTCTQDEEIC